MKLETLFRQLSHIPLNRSSAISIIALRRLLRFDASISRTAAGMHMRSSYNTSNIAVVQIGLKVSMKKLAN